MILTSVTLNAVAQLFLRWGARSAAESTTGSLIESIASLALRPSILVGLACYGVSILVWLYVLGRVEVSFAYPFLALGFVMVAIAGWQLFGESMPPMRVAGIAIVVVGVLVLARS
ncbi:MAG TPA: SMR family transporter [Ancylobacter sp.]